MITALDHVNLQTRQLDVMIDWYCKVLGLTHGPRPDFPFPGAWIYAGDQPIIHLVEKDDAPRGGGALALEHVALRATGLKELLAKLDARGETYKINETEYLPIVLVNVWDPDGNHLHIDFDKAEAQGLVTEAPSERVEPG